MSFLTPEQFAAAHKANVETFFGLTNKAFESLEKLVELNLQVVKTTLEESASNTQKALAVKDAQEWLALQANLFQPNAEKAIAYGRHVYEIASSTQAEFNKVAEAELARGSQGLQALVDNFAKNAPAGAEPAVAVVKSALTAANSAYDSVQKAAKQAVELAESNFSAATSAATKAAQQAGRTTAKK